MQLSPNSAHTEHWDLCSLEMGPFHPSLPGNLKVKLQLLGEKIVSAQFQAGFLKRGIESLMTQKNWVTSKTISTRINPEASVVGEMLYCLCLETLCGVSVSNQAKTIRLIVLELTRISSHLTYLARVAKAIKAETAMHLILRDREVILDLFELLTGARFSLHFITVGGARFDITAGFLERVLEFCELIRFRIKEYNDFFIYNSVFLDRSKGVGQVTQADVIRNQVSGPNARAAGCDVDERKSPAGLGLGYSQIDFKSVFEEGKSTADVHDRVTQRLQEMVQSAELLRRMVDQCSKENNERKIILSWKDVVPNGSASATLEAPTGEMSMSVTSSGGIRPAGIKIKTPSLNTLALMTEALSGAYLEDLELVVGSFDLSVSEVDL